VAVWIVQYVYRDKDGGTTVSTSRLHAPNRESAMTAAARSAPAPAEEFTLTVHAESDDQHLGAVRHRAMELAGRAIIVTGGEESGMEAGMENGGEEAGEKIDAGEE